MSIPEHVPNILRRGHVAKVLNIKDEQVAYLTRTGRIPIVGEQYRYTNGWVEYSPHDIAAFAESRNITPKWNALKE